MNYNAKLNFQMVLSGKYYNASETTEFNNIVTYMDKLNRQIARETPQKIMYKLLKDEDFDFYYKKHLCPDCSNMIHCEKVLDLKKKNLECYPFIKEGILIETFFEKNNNCTFNDKDNEENRTKINLLNNGKVVNYMSVFNCENFVDDEPIKNKKHL